jgi:hypothetical protein
VKRILPAELDPQDTSRPIAPPVTPKVLRLVGETLFGSKWQMPLARALAQHGQEFKVPLIYQWDTGRTRIPAWVHGAMPYVIAAWINDMHERLTFAADLRNRIHVLTMGAAVSGTLPPDDEDRPDLLPD